MPWISSGPCRRPCPTSAVSRSCTTVFGGSSGDAASSPSSPAPDLRRRRRRRRRVAPSPAVVVAVVVVSSESSDRLSRRSESASASPSVSPSESSSSPSARHGRGHGRGGHGGGAGWPVARAGRRRCRVRLVVSSSSSSSSSASSAASASCARPAGARRTAACSRPLRGHPGRSPASAGTRARRRFGSSEPASTSVGQWPARFSASGPDAPAAGPVRWPASTSRTRDLVVRPRRLRAAGPPVEFGQRIEHPPAGGAEHPRQRVDPQPFGERPRAGCGRLPIVLEMGHRRPRILLKPPGASCSTRPREGFRYVPGFTSPGLVMVSPRAVSWGTHSVPG